MNLNVSMNRLIPILVLILVATAPTAAVAQSKPERDPAYLDIDKAIDLKTLRPEVNVNLPRFLLQEAVSDLTGTDDPFAGAGINLADLIKDVKHIRFLVIEANDTNKAALARGVAALRSTLEADWIPLATVSEENVGVYAMGDPSGETMAGLAVLIADDGDAVIGNIVGRVSIGKIIKVASRMDKFPKDLLKKLTKGVEGGEKKEKKAESAPAPSETSAK